MGVVSKDIYDKKRLEKFYFKSSSFDTTSISLNASSFMMKTQSFRRKTQTFISSLNLNFTDLFIVVILNSSNPYFEFYGF